MNQHFPNQEKKTRKSFEYWCSQYKNRMEFIRTIIGITVLVIQIVIVYHLITK